MTFKYLLAKAGLTQEELARQLAVSQTTISHWCNRKVFPHHMQYRRLASALGVSLDEVLDCFYKEVK